MLLSVTKYYTILFISLFSLSIQHNKQKQYKSLIDDYQNIASLTKECVLSKECNYCSFEEIKIEDACYYTSYYKIKQCYYYDSEGNKKYEENIKEKCYGSNYKFYFFYISIFGLLGIGCMYIRKKEKQKLVTNIFNRNNNSYLSLKFK